MKPAIPFTSISPHLYFQDCETALKFYQEAFGAEIEWFNKSDRWDRMEKCSLRMFSTSFVIADSIMFTQRDTDPHKAFGFIAMQIHCLDCQSVYNRATAAGAFSIEEPRIRFWGSLWAQVKDPFGVIWYIDQKVYDLTSEQMDARAAREFT